MSDNGNSGGQQGGGDILTPLPFLMEDGPARFLSAEFGNAVVQLLNAVKLMAGKNGLTVNISDGGIIIDPGPPQSGGVGTQLSVLYVSDESADNMTLDCAGSPAGPPEYSVIKPTYLQGSYSLPKLIWPKYNSSDPIVVAQLNDTIVDLNVDARTFAYKIFTGEDCTNTSFRYISCSQLNPP